MLTTIALPVVSNVTMATPSAPFFGLMVASDPRVIMQPAAEMEVERPPKESSCRALSVGNLEPMILDALIRLVRLLDEPKRLSAPTSYRRQHNVEGITALWPLWRLQ